MKEHEGLDYGTMTQNNEYEKADCLESHLENGKYTTGATPSAEHEKAETLRMLGQGSHDPMYGHSKKNK